MSTGGQEQMDRLQTMRLVILESPFSGKDDEEIRENIRYARRCIRDCLVRGDAPIASHLLFTQPGILRDEIRKERNLGISAGLAWYRVARASVVYTDRGISEGMRIGIREARRHGVPVEYRELMPEAEINRALDEIPGMDEAMICLPEPGPTGG